jgi:hypothetical protein
MMNDENSIQLRMLLIEYERLKEEQLRRIGFRDNLIYATFASVGAILLFTYGTASRREALLLVPPVCLVLGWTYLANDQKISAIGLYIRRELSNSISTIANIVDGVFLWEHEHRSDERRRSRKYLQLTVDLLTFCGPGVVSVLVFWLLARTSYVLVGVSIAEMLGIGILLQQIVTYADLRRGQ